MMLAAVVVLSFLSTNSFGQLSIGIKVNTPSFSSKESSRTYFEPSTKSEYLLTYLSTRSSLGFGLSFYQEIDKVFILTDLLLNSKTSAFRLNTVNRITRSVDSREDIHTLISIPLIAGFKKNNFKIGLGPLFNVKLESEYGLENTEGFNLRERKVNKAVQFLIGYTIKDHIHLDLRHEISLGSEGDDYHIVGNPLKIYSHPQSFSVSVGVFL